MLRFLRMSSIYAQIDAAGGLATKAGLAKRWGVTQTMIGKYVRRDGFPTAIKVNDGTRDRDVWLVGEADAWFTDHRRPTE